MGALPKMRVRVWINPQDDGEPREVIADIRHVDRLTAEKSLVGQGIKTEDGLLLHMTSAWSWAALKRQGDYDGPLERFMFTDCLGTEDVEDDPEVDPTQEAPPTGSPSSSPSPSPGPRSSIGPAPTTG